MGAVMSGLLTVTLTAVEVVLLPAASRATAVSVWLPLADWVVFHDTLYPCWGREGAGGGVLGAQIGAVQLELHPGHPDVVGGGGGQVHAVPDTVAPLAGAVRLTVGGVVSPPGRARPDCWVCGAAALTCAKADGAAVASAAVTVTGADNCIVDGSARACGSP